MNRNINRELVKRLRSEMGWSQEELAIATGLSVRTIQRLEAEGGGSLNSIKSIASALEVDMHNLEDKPRTQLIGSRWGFGGVLVGTACAIMAIFADWTVGQATTYDIGVSFGALGLLAGTACAIIGWLSSR